MSPARSIEVADSELPTCGQLSGHLTAKDTLCASTILTYASGKTACYMGSVPEDVKRAATSKGGEVTARLARHRNPTAVNPSLRTMAEIQEFIEDTAGRLDRGEISERGANARMQVADKAIRANVENFADRLDELEKLAASRARSEPRVRVLR
jgi:hypothetical protein